MQLFIAYIKLNSTWHPVFLFTKSGNPTHKGFVRSDFGHHLSLNVPCSLTQATLFWNRLCPFPRFPCGWVVKNLPDNAGDVGGVGWIPGSGRSPGGGQGNPLQYSCLENLMDRGAWWATEHGVTKRQTRLSPHTCRLSSASL